MSHTSRNGVGKVFAFLNRFDSPLLTYVAWDGQGGGGAGSTQVAVSSLAGTVTTTPVSTNWASSAGFHFDASGNLLMAGGAGGSSQVTLSQVLDSSNGGVVVGDSVNSALRVNVVAGAAGGSTIVTVSTGSVRVHQSTAADLNVTVAGYSTTVNVSSLAGKVLVDQNSTVWPVQVSSVAGVVTVQQNSTTWAVQMTQYSTTVQVSSLAGKVLVDQNSTVWQTQAAVRDNLGNLIESSTNAVNSTARGLFVRSAGVSSTTVSGQAAAAGDNTIMTSAVTAIYVYAYCLSPGPVSTAAQLIRFLSGSTTECWRLRCSGGSTVGIQNTYSQLAVTPPAYLFKVAGSSPLVLNATSSGVNYSVAGWRE